MKLADTPSRVVIEQQSDHSRCYRLQREITRGDQAEIEKQTGVEFARPHTASARYGVIVYKGEAFEWTGVEPAILKALGVENAEIKRTPDEPAQPKEPRFDLDFFLELASSASLLAAAAAIATASVVLTARALGAL